MAAAGYVYTCVQADEAGTCTAYAWMPPPQLIPRLSVEGAGQILVAAYLCMGVAWGWKKLGQSVRS